MAASSPQSKPLLVLAYVVFVVAAGTLVYGFVSVSREAESRRRCSALCLLHPEYAAADRKAPDFTLSDTKGQPHSLSSYRGKVVVLNFWTKTCGPCLEEMPQIADLAKILRERSDTAVIAVSTDDGPDDVRDVLKGVLREEPPFTILFDPDAKIVSGKYGTHLFPETWILDKRGVIRARFDGAREWSNSAVVEFVDQLRSGGYCPLEVHEGRPSGEGSKLCQELTGT